MKLPQKIYDYTEYKLNEGDLVMDVSVDYTQGNNYGDD